MARGLTLSAGLTAFIALVLVHETCTATAKVNHHCAPSSCGNILNISFPFRLKSDPEKCGDSRYELSCENNHTVLYLFEGKYYVQEINYNNFTIRVVDSGIQKDIWGLNICARCYSLNRHNFSQYRSAYTIYQPKNWLGQGPPLSRSVVLMRCEKPVNSPSYVDTSTCIKDNSSIAHFKSYRYVKVGRTNATDVEDSCKVEQMFQTSWPGNDDQINIFCADVHNELVYGFELSWLRGTCKSYCRRRRHCYLNDGNHVDCGGGFLLMIIADSLGLIMATIGLQLAAKIVLGIPCVIVFFIYKWRRRHLSMYDAVEEFLQSQNNLMPIRYSFSQIRKMTKDHSSQIFFPTWVYSQFSEGNDIEMEGATEEEKKIAKKMILVALWCIQMKPSDRPSMNKVVEMLEGEVECLQMPSKPFLLSSPKRPIGDVGDNLDSTSSSIQSPKRQIEDVGDNLNSTSSSIQSGESSQSGELQMQIS
ncbi:hypothetical protein CMV_025584 [Castanea mollissima]|uniref:Wall-associated receptor kinase galacturonan-binding domain-containing protein n=1 Tax=Castanea mollissima TaxID=60419 RepID=A0A8J4VGS6_9ROSI|nr:hypothetical protein CMV_025584 [Castanea mollissima]